MRTDALAQSKAVVDVNLMEAVPKDAEIVEVRRAPNGTVAGIVCREVETRKVGSRPATDENGKPVERSDQATGQYRYPVQEPVMVTEEREYLLHPTPTGRALKNYHFRPSEEAVRERKRRAARKEVADELVDAMVEKGVSPKEMLERLFGSEEAEELEVSPEEEPEPFVLTQKRPGGHWILPDGEVTDSMSREDAEKIVREVFGREPVREGES